MNTKNVNKLVIIPLVFILVLTLSITYALFTKEVNTNNRNITLSSINKYIGIYGPNKNNIELNKDYTFTIENRGSIGSGYEVYIESETNIDLSTITYQVTGDITASGNLSNSAIIYSALSSDDKKTITLRLTSTSTESYIGKIKVRYKDYIVNYDYTGTAQTFNAPAKGTYKMELWGAQGGSFGSYVSGGAYTRGNISLEELQSIYVYVGRYSFDSSNNSYVFNYGYHNYSRNGGGSTDIRVTGGNWDDSTSINSRIMVAAGAGASGGLNSYDGGTPYGGAAGGLIGYQGGPCISNNVTNHPGANGATQTSGHSFGIVPNRATSDPNSSYNTGGGNGYYSGNYYNWTGVGGHSAVSGAGGGSSYISGHTGCVAITSKTDRTPKAGCTTGTTNNSCSIHYSGYKFNDTVMIDGLGYKWTNAKESYVGQPQPNGTTTAGHTGNGYARITYVGN